MAMKQLGIDCWTSLSRTDGALQPSHEHDEGNVFIKEEGEVEKETCLSIPGSDGLRYEGQLVTQDGLVFTIKREVDTDMFASLSSTEGQDPSTEQEMVSATIKQEDEEIFEPITTLSEGGGETEQSIPEGNICIKEEGEVEKETCLSIPGSDGLRYEGQLVTQDGLVFTIKREVDTDMFASLSSTEGQDPSTEQEMVSATIKQEDEEIFEPITTLSEGGGETEQSIPEDRELDNGQDKIHSHITACSGEKSHPCLHCSKTFTDEKNLILHQKRHQVEYELTHHLRTHYGEKPFKCSQYDEAVSQRSTLISHLRTHSGEKPHRCPYCDREFSQKTKLTSHLRTHTGKKPFKCSHCDKDFSQQNHLTRHLITHTGKKPLSVPSLMRVFLKKVHLLAI
eukprot:XP_011678199.1 PREDICTED: zinc finger protein 7-like [Strongylocentrotus purpuratus]